MCVPKSGRVEVEVREPSLCVGSFRRRVYGVRGVLLWERAQQRSEEACDWLRDIRVALMHARKAAPSVSSHHSPLLTPTHANMSVPLSIFLIGGHGRVAQLFTRHAAEAGHTVVSQIRNADHAKDLPMPSSGTGKVVPLVESLEALSVSRLAELLRDHAPNVVVFSAGAGGKGGPRRTQAVDRDGAIKVFDALEKSGIAMDQRRFRRFLLVSAVDVRNTETTKPSWYSEDECVTQEGVHTHRSVHNDLAHMTWIPLHYAFTILLSPFSLSLHRLPALRRPSGCATFWAHTCKPNVRCAPVLKTAARRMRRCG